MAIKQKSASASRSIKIITTAVFVLNGAFYAAAFYRGAFSVAAIGLTAIILACYLFWTPVAYELAGDGLTVVFRASRKRFGPVIGCSTVEEPLPRATIRLWGDGGLFAGSGIFWNKRYGVFRAYVTRAKHTDWVLIETPGRKIIISPADPQGFFEAGTM